MSVTFDFTGKTVLVTGASSGIGYGIAEGFARAGADLIILSETETIYDAAESLPGKVRAIRCDIADAAMVTEALADIERVDVLVNNAGLERPTPLNGANPLGNATFERIVAINITGTQNVTDALISRIPEGGRILNTASIWARTAVPGFSAYVASKHALLGLTRTWAQELGPRGIRVNAICPGFVRTSMQEREVEWEASLRGMTPEEVIADYVSQTPLGRIETPEDVADVAIFLASNSARFMTGQGVNVTGGVYMT